MDRETEVIQTQPKECWQPQEVGRTREDILP